MVVYQGEEGVDGRGLSTSVPIGLPRPILYGTTVTELVWGVATQVNCARALDYADGWFRMHPVRAVRPGPPPAIDSEHG